MVDVIDDTDVTFVLDATLPRLSVTDGSEDTILLLTLILVEVTDLTIVCSLLLDIVLIIVDATLVVEIVGLMVVNVDVVDCTLLLDAVNATDDVEVCSLLDVV